MVLIISISYLASVTRVLDAARGRATVEAGHNAYALRANLADPLDTGTVEVVTDGGATARAPLTHEVVGAAGVK
jgi:hypothetical protein